MLISAIRVGFSVSEFAAEESDIQKIVTLSVNNPVAVDTHFFVRAMTYQQYEEEYDSLTALYPDLPKYTLTDEYDSAECEYICINLFKF